MAVLKDETEDEALAGGEAAPTPQSVQGASSMGGGEAAAGGAPSGANPSYTQSNFTSGKMILDANKDAQQPDLTQGFAQKAADASTGMAKAQTDYQKSLADKQAAYGYDDNTVNSALGGDDASFQKLKSMLSGNDKVSAYAYNPNLDIQDVNKLNSTAGAQDELTQQAQKNNNFNYGQGQAALDATLFGRSATAQNQVQSALAQKKSVEDAAAKAATDQAAAQQAAQGNITGKVSGLYSKLGGMLSGVQDQALQNRVNYIQEHGAGDQEAASKALYQTAVSQAKQQAEADAGGDPEYQKALESQYLDQIDKNKNNLADLGYQDNNNYLYDDALAGRFNKLNDLLGNKLSKQSAGSMDNPSAKLGKGYQDALKQGKPAAEKYLADQKADQESYANQAAERERARNERTQSKINNQFGVPATVADKIKSANDNYMKSQLGKYDYGAQASEALGRAVLPGAQKAGAKIADVGRATGRDASNTFKKAKKGW